MRLEASEVLKVLLMTKISLKSNSWLKPLTLVFPICTFSVFVKRYLMMYLTNFPEIFRAY